MDDQQRNTLTKAREHYKRKEFDRAKLLLERAVESGVTGFADVHNMLGVIHHDQGDRPLRRRPPPDGAPRAAQGRRHP